MAKGNNQKPSNGSALDFEAQLWAAADKMRGHMDASEYKHVCLGLIFLKYISDAFEEKREQLLFGFSDPKSEWFIKDEPQRAEAAENRVAAGAPVSDPARFKFAVSNAPDRRSALRFTEECRILRNADSFRQDLHPDLKADLVPVRKDLANPPFNMSDWGGENLRQDVRWKFGMPPVNNANYAWIQHFIHHLSSVGVAGFVMANSAYDALDRMQ